MSSDAVGEINFASFRARLKFGGKINDAAALATAGKMVEKSLHTAEGGLKGRRSELNVKVVLKLMFFMIPVANRYV